jgi:hypothetical protein
MLRAAMRVQVRAVLAPMMAPMMQEQLQQLQQRIGKRRHPAQRQHFERTGSLSALRSPRLQPRLVAQGLL